MRRWPKHSEECDAAWKAYKAAEATWNGELESIQPVGDTLWAFLTAPCPACDKPTPFDPKEIPSAEPPAPA